MSLIPSLRKCKTHYFESGRLVFIGVVPLQLEESLFGIMPHKPGLRRDLRYCIRRVNSLLSSEVGSLNLTLRGYSSGLLSYKYVYFYARRVVKENCLELIGNPLFFERMNGDIRVDNITNECSVTREV